MVLLKVKVNIAKTRGLYFIKKGTYFGLYIVYWLCVDISLRFKLLNDSIFIALLSYKTYVINYMRTYFLVKHHLVCTYIV